METNPYTFYLAIVSGSSDKTVLMRTCNNQAINGQTRDGTRFIDILRATLRRWAVLCESEW